MENYTENRYVAGMVLSAVGDALGFKNGQWKFERNGEKIHDIVKEQCGVANIHVKPPKWRVSDDTVMHLATAEALLDSYSNPNSTLDKIAERYVKCMEDMSDRQPEETCVKMCRVLKPYEKDGFRIPFDPRGGGCGAATRSMCIGLRFPRPEEFDDLIAVSVEAGRMTHHHPSGYLGSLASALFTSFAVQGIPLREWGCRLLDTLEDAKKYICSTKCYVQENLNCWGYFKEKWTSYLLLRGLLDGKQDAIFLEDENIVRKRDQLYTWFSCDGWGGASGHDAPMIAYDALLACEGNWEELCNRAMFHGGDSDSTGVIAGCLFGVLYGMDRVPKCNYENVEYKKRLDNIGSSMWRQLNGLNGKEESSSQRCTTS